ncbi:MAG: FHA domain-containing protein [Planctomycetes bacterium]|nr:FHA domain-containing protein [Planctomycetota bacterium]
MPERFVLKIEGGSRAGERVSLSGDRFTVGRKPGNSLVLQDASVSGAHCELLRTADGWLLRDCGSTNGTFVNGEKITLPTTLKSGANFALGSVAIVLEVETGGASPAGGSAAEEISLEEPDAAPQPQTIKSVPPQTVKSTSSGLEFVEDEPQAPQKPRPRAGASAGMDSTIVMKAAAASAMGVLTSSREMVATGDEATVVADAETLERARVAAAAQAKRGRLLTIGGGAGAILLLAGAGVVFYSQKESGGPAVKKPPVVAGNLLIGSASNFEIDADAEQQKGARWNFRDASLEPESLAASGFGLTTKKSASGARGVEAKLEGGAYARATTDFMRVSSGQTLQFAVQAMSTKPVGAVQLIFKQKGETGARSVRCGAVLESGANAFVKIGGTARVPSGFDQAALSVVAMGDGGAAWFDDAEIVISENPPAEPPMIKKEFEFERDPIDGRIHRIDRNLVGSMGILIGAPGAARSRAFAAGRGEGDAWTLCSPDGKGGKVNLTIDAGDTSVLYHYKYQGAVPAALVWTVERAFATELVVRGSKTTGRYRGEFTEPACASIVAGEEGTRLRFTFDPPCAVKAVPESGGIRIEMELPGSLNIQIQYSFDAEKRRALELEQSAESAQKLKKYGEAIRLRAQILDEFPFERALVERNETKFSEQLAQGQKEAAEIERRVADAEFFKIPEAFREARRMGTDLANLYVGTDVAERAKAAIASVETALVAAESERGERDALRLQTISTAFDAANAHDLSGYIREYIKKNYSAAGKVKPGDAKPGGEQPGNK